MSPFMLFCFKDEARLATLQLFCESKYLQRSSKERFGTEPHQVVQGKSQSTGASGFVVGT